VVSYHFGSSSVGGLRWHGFGKHLVKAGWEVHVVTATPPEEVEAPEGVHVHHCPPRGTLNDAYLKLTRSLRANGSRSAEREFPGAPPDVDAREHSAPGLGGIVATVRKNLSQFLNFPDSARGWFLPAFFRTRALLSSRRFDLAISSGPPHSGHLVAAAAARGRSVPYWVDMRDPWGDFLVADDSRTPLIRRLHCGLERWVFGGARLVLTNSEPYADALRKSYPALTVRTVPNGVDLERLPTDDPEPLPGVNLAHVGSIYLGRDVGPVLAAMSYAADLDRAVPATLHLVGNIVQPHRTRVMRQVSEQDLEDQVRLVGRVPRGEALDILRRCTYAVVLAQGQPLQVPAKLYECVALGLPTIVITEQDSATASEARKMGALVYSDDQARALGETLADARSDAVRAELAAPSELSYAARTEILKAILRAEL
jgi:glycosyltransferase involved in cell wall biosynthesis